MERQRKPVHKVGSSFCTVNCQPSVSNCQLSHLRLGQAMEMFIYLGFYVAFNTVQVISRQVVLWVEETSTYSWSSFCTVNCQPLVSNYQLSHIRSGVWTTDHRGGRQVCDHYHNRSQLRKWNLGMYDLLAVLAPYLVVNPSHIISFTNQFTLTFTSRLVPAPLSRVLTGSSLVTDQFKSLVTGVVCQVSHFISCQSHSPVSGVW